MPAVGAVTLGAFAASVAYLHFVPTYGGYSMAGELAGWAVLVTATILVLLAAAGYLRENRIVTCVYHLVLATWFFAIAFPYLGEFCC